jgi:hypothetical protein
MKIPKPIRDAIRKAFADTPADGQIYGTGVRVRRTPETLASVEQILADGPRPEGYENIQCTYRALIISGKLGRVHLVSGHITD